MFLYPLQQVKDKVARYGSADAVHDALTAAITETEWGNCHIAERRSRILELNRVWLRSDYAADRPMCRSAMPGCTWARI